jgi:glycosyltransferase involved in cell wall biosynthesis
MAADDDVTGRADHPCLAAMRFLVVYNGPLNPDSGSSGTVWQTSSALRELGHEVDEVFEDRIGRSISHPNLHYSFELPRRILHTVKNSVRKNQYDVLLISQPYGYLVGKWLRERPDAPLYLHRSHGHELAVGSRIASWRNATAGLSKSAWRNSATRLLAMRLRRQARLALRYADGTIVPCSYDRDFLIHEEAVDPKRVRCIFHASTPAYLAAPPTPYTEERHRRLLYVGSLSRIKGGEILWQLGTSNLRRFPELSLTMVVQLADHARAIAGFDRDVACRIRLLDWMDQRSLMEVYDQHGLQIVPSLYEGAGKVHYEGMSRGLALVCSGIGAMADSIASGENGLLVRPGDQDGYLVALRTLIENYRLAQSISEKARKRSAEFTWERTASEIVAYAEELIVEKSEHGSRTQGSSLPPRSLAAKTQ